MTQKNNKDRSEVAKKGWETRRAMAYAKANRKEIIETAILNAVGNIDAAIEAHPTKPLATMVDQDATGAVKQAVVAMSDGSHTVLTPPKKLTTQVAELFANILKRPRIGGAS